MKNKIVSRSIAAMALVVALVFVGLPASGSNHIHVDSPIKKDPLAVGPLAPTLKDLSASVSDPVCSGTYYYDADVSDSDRELLATNSAFWVVIALVVVIVLLSSSIEPTDPGGDFGTMYWSYTCSATVTAKANGEGGLYRRVAIQAPDRNGNYVDLSGASCTYDGVLRSDCLVPARAVISGVPGGGDEGQMDYPYDGDLPGSVTVCVNTAMRAINHPQYEPTGILFPAVTENYSESCDTGTTDITWTHSPPTEAFFALLRALS